MRKRGQKLGLVHRTQVLFAWNHQGVGSNSGHVSLKKTLYCNCFSRADGSCDWFSLVRYITVNCGTSSQSIPLFYDAQALKTWWQQTGRLWDEPIWRLDGELKRRSALHRVAAQALLLTREPKLCKEWNKLKCTCSFPLVVHYLIFY